MSSVVELDGVGSVAAADVDHALASKAECAMNRITVPRAGNATAERRLGRVAVAVVVGYIAIEGSPLPAQIQMSHAGLSPNPWSRKRAKGLPRYGLRRRE